jgi:hypothetical protein
MVIQQPTKRSTGERGVVATEFAEVVGLEQVALPRHPRGTDRDDRDAGHHGFDQAEGVAGGLGAGVEIGPDAPQVVAHLVVGQRA